MNREEALKAIKSGSIAAYISGGLTLAVFLIASFSNASGELGHWNDPAILFDILLIFGCAYGISRKSRFAAVFIFLYFILSKIYIGIELGRMSGLAMGLVFLYFYGKAIQGTFVFHKIEKSENPNYKPTSKLAYYAGIPVLVLFVAALGFGLMTMTGVVPSTEVQSGAEMFRKDKDTLISSNIISVDDEVLFFYSEGLTSILEGGQVLTDDRVIMYLNDENLELQVYEIYFDDIASVELVQMGNAMNLSIYQVNSYEPDAWIQIALSAENKGDIVFVEALRKKVQERIF